MNRTSIEWADYSVNPIRARNIATGKAGWHCERVSEGCAACYASTLSKRFGGLDYAADKTPKVEFFLDEKTLQKMLTFRPKGPFKNGRDRPAVFVEDMSDLFGHWVTNEWLDRIFAVFALRADVDWLVLTKRARRMREYLSEPLSSLVRRGALHVIADEIRPGAPVPVAWPLPNVWPGVSCENQARADERIPDLLATPAARRFISAEPLLGPVDLSCYMWPVHDRWPSAFWSPDAARAAGAVVTRHRQALVSASAVFLNWVIVGGESGHGARPCEVSWIRSIRDQCAAAGVPCFVKQDSAPRPGMQGRIPNELFVKEMPL